MSATPEFTDTQLTVARASAWHQAGDPLLTLEAARAWVGNYGLVMFAPRAQTLGAPAPSLVEATLGEANSAPTAAQSDVALGLLARMVDEGSAVPLNLLGGPGDVPDFVASAQVFSFCYTLRGDKGWKQPPAQTGAVKVSPLALRVFEVLTERGSLTASALVTELGREVTETAVVRGLGELWGQLRVLPRRSGGTTAWELTTQRFTKAIKAGSNAGQPKALSALVSLYLHQAISASEGEIESFLSPLTARSRVREVIHALTSARELETLAIDGKTLLYVADALPEFAAAEPAAAGASEDEAAGDLIVPVPVAAEKGEGRISRFRSAGARSDDLRGKPLRSSPVRKSTGGGAFDRGRPSRPPAFGRGADRREDGAARSARPASSGRPTSSDRPMPGGRPPAREERTSAFTRPWSEGRPDRPARSSGAPSPGSGPGGGDRPQRAFRPRSTEGDGPPRPYRPRSAEADGSPRPFRPRPAEGAEGRPSRKPSDGGSREFRPGAKPGGPPRSGGAFGRKREDGGDRSRPADRASRPERRPFARDGEQREPFGSRAPRPERRLYTRSADDRGSASGSAEKRPFRPRSDGPGAEPGSRAPRAPRADWAPRGDRPSRPAGAGGGFKPAGGRAPFKGGSKSGSSDRPDRADRPRRPAAAEGGGSSPRSSGYPSRGAGFPSRGGGFPPRGAGRSDGPSSSRRPSGGSGSADRSAGPGIKRAGFRPSGPNSRPGGRPSFGGASGAGRTGAPGAGRSGFGGRAPGPPKRTVGSGSPRTGAPGGYRSTPRARRDEPDGEA